MINVTINYYSDDICNEWLVGRVEGNFMVR